MSEPDQSSSIQAQLRDVKTTSTVAGAKEGPHVESPLVPSDALATQHAPINQETSLHPVGKTPQPVISKPPGSESMLSRPKPRILVPWSGKSGEAIRLTGDLRDALIGLGAELVDVPPGERLGYGLTSLFLTVDVVVFPLIDIDTEDHIVRACLSVAEEFGGSSVTRVPVALIPWTPLQESVPKSLSQFARLRYADPKAAARAVLGAAEEFSRRRAARRTQVSQEEQAAAERDRFARAESAAAQYIQTSLTDLNVREGKYRVTAAYWYTTGCAALILGIVVAVYRATRIDYAAGASWPEFAEFTILGGVAIGLLIAVSKYAFNLGKAYMNEALRCADRAHAISFGQLYLKAFAPAVEWKEVKEAFQNWNIDRGSSFLTQQSSEFDPKMLELVVDVAKTALERANSSTNKTS